MPLECNDIANERHSATNYGKLRLRFISTKGSAEIQIENEAW